jgi:hypothetical protein
MAELRSGGAQDIFFTWKRCIRLREQNIYLQDHMDKVECQKYSLLNVNISKPVC